MYFYSTISTAEKFSKDRNDFTKVLRGLLEAPGANFCGNILTFVFHLFCSEHLRQHPQDHASLWQSPKAQLSSIFSHPGKFGRATPSICPKATNKHACSSSGLHILDSMAGLTRNPKKRKPKKIRKIYVRRRLGFTVNA